VFQFFRSTAKIVESQALKPTVGYSKLRQSIQVSRPNDNVMQLKSLPKRSSILQVFARKRKRAQIENFNPLNPPETLFVSFCLKNGKLILF